jgi:hypothetical protein
MSLKEMDGLGLNVLVNKQTEMEREGKETTGKWKGTEREIRRNEVRKRGNEARFALVFFWVFIISGFMLEDRIEKELDVPRK